MHSKETNIRSIIHTPQRSLTKGKRRKPSGVTQTDHPQCALSTHKSFTRETTPHILVRQVHKHTKSLAFIQQKARSSSHQTRDQRSDQYQDTRHSKASNFGRALHNLKSALIGTANRLLFTHHVLILIKADSGWSTNRTTVCKNDPIVCLTCSAEIQSTQTKGRTNVQCMVHQQVARSKTELRPPKCLQHDWPKPSRAPCTRPTHGYGKGATSCQNPSRSPQGGPYPDGCERR